MAIDKIEKLSYSDAMMIEKIVDTLNQLIEMVEYLDGRIDRHWKMHRIEEKQKKES